MPILTRPAHALRLWRVARQPRFCLPTESVRLAECCGSVFWEGLKKRPRSMIHVDDTEEPAVGGRRHGQRDSHRGVGGLHGGRAG